MLFPWHNLQFWIVTAIFVAALGYVLRNVLPIPWLSKRARAAKGERQATLTISAKKPDSPAR